MTDLTGGLVYHFRAWRYRSRLWQPFRQHLNDWLAHQLAPAPTLIWVGASAGYCVDAEITERFKQIIVCEPDPMAAFLLKRHHSNLKVISSDLLELKSASPFARFEQLLELHPKAVILFSNLLGQIAYISQGETENRLQLLKAKLRHRDWMSFHDRLSTRAAQLTVERQHWQANRPLPNSALIEKFFGSATALTVLDHRTVELEEQMKPLYLHWQLTREQHHLIGCIHHQPG